MGDNPWRTSADRPETVDSRANHRAAKTPMSLRSPGVSFLLLLLRPVAHRLDLVAVGFAQEGAVIEAG